jgi:elongation factor P
MVNVNDLKNGMSIMYENNIYTVIETQHVKPGKGAAFVKAKLKNLRTGANIEITFNSSLKVEKAHVEKTNMQVLYLAGESYNFMNMETYEQVEIPLSKLGEDASYLKEDLNVDLSFYEGEMIGLSLPDKIEYKIIKTEPAVRGNTTNNATKEAVLENNLTVKVPLFIEEGEIIIVSTKDGKYVSRA